MCVNN